MGDVDGAALCRCGHPREWHAVAAVAGTTFCLYYRDRCLCAAFVAAAPASEQIGLFDGAAVGALTHARAPGA